METAAASGDAAPRLAVSAIVRRGGKFLLVLRSNPPAAGMYAFPGGRVEPDETREEAVLRELLEETGLRGSSPRLFEVFDLSREADRRPHFLLSVYMVEVAGAEEPEARDDAASVGWYDIAEARRLPMPESMFACLDMLERLGPL